MGVHMVTKASLAIALAVGLTACAVPVNAQSGRYGYPSQNTRVRTNTAYAFDQGYQDGYAEGRDDGRDRDRYEPHNSGNYRDADNGYRNQSGSRQLFRVNYRDGFVSGYDAGYRDGQRTARNRSRGRVYGRY